MPVEIYMSAPVFTVKASEELPAVQERLRDHRVSSMVVVDDDSRPVGVISRTDLIRVGRVETGRRPKSALLVLPNKPVSAEMTSGVASVPLDAPIRQAGKLMIDKRVHRVFVADGERLVGVVSTKDVMVAISNEKVRKPVSEFMSSPVFTVRVEEPLSLATERLERAHVSGLVVVDNAWPVGVFTQEESLLSASLPRDTPLEDAMSPAMLCMDVETLVHRAAAQAAATRARRVICTHGRDMKGILTGLDFARATQA
jgi:predicted transcriptional regulator